MHFQGKRKIFKKFMHKILKNVLTKMKVTFIIIIVVSNQFKYADVAELVDAQDLKSCG